MLAARAGAACTCCMLNKEWCGSSLKAKLQRDYRSKQSSAVVEDLQDLKLLRERLRRRKTRGEIVTFWGHIQPGIYTHMRGIT